jgi:hypothetical protein
MGRARQVIAGLRLEDHQQLGLELAAIEEAVLELRTRIREAEGAADVTYTTAGRVVSGLKAWRHVLHRALIDTHGDRPAHRTIYEAKDGTP